MTLDEIYERAYAIRDMNDYEQQHAEEDRLHIDVLTAIADCSIGNMLLRQAAAAALKTIEFDFPRHCA